MPKKHCKVIVLENLKNIKDSEKCGRSVQRSQWSYAQLESFISYKASLLGVPVIFVRPEYTSKMCSRCGKINEPNSKRYKCSACGHKDHRDANASFNIAIRGKKTYGIPEVERFASVGCIDTPLTSKGRVC